MKIRKQSGPPKDLIYFDEDINLTQNQVEDVVEIFNTPLTGSYNWDYSISDNRIKKLYELGKELNWNGSIDLNWEYTHPADERIVEPDEELPHETLQAYENLTEEEKILFDRHSTAELMSQFLHGEQGALLVASQLASCAPTYNAKLYAASQTFDEARHVEVFNRYLQEKIGIHYPINPSLKLLLDKILTDERWDLKFIGMQIIIEGLALAAFNLARQGTFDPVFKDLLYLIIRDEARHVTFGVNYLEEFIKTLSDEEREERAQFAYEACLVMRGRLMSSEVYEHFGWDIDDAVAFQSKSDITNNFQHLLFTRVVPNLARIGLLTDKVKPLYDKLGVLEYQDWPTDGEIDWASLERPLDKTEEVEQGQFMSV